METKLSILLVEDDPSTCKKIVDLIEASDDFELCGVTNNAHKATEYISDTLPEAIILDLELHQGCGSGLNVLTGIKDLSLDFLPYILVTTNNSSAITYESARQLGADYIMSKHQENYSEKTPLEFLKMLTPAIKNKRKQSDTSNPVTQSPANREKHLTRRIINELNNVGISPKSVGFQYLIDAIIITIDKPTQNICNIIAKKHSKTEASVERAMQNAINRAWAITDIDELLEHYTAKINSYKGVPTLTEFIFYYANKIRNNY